MDGQDKFKVALSMLADFNIEIDPAAIRSDSRDANLVFHRALVVWVLDEFGLTSSAIGKLLNRDHATVLYLLKYGSIKRKSTLDLQNKYREVISKINVKGVAPVDVDWLINNTTARMAHTLNSRDFRKTMRKIIEGFQERERMINRALDIVDERYENAIQS